MKKTGAWWATPQVARSRQSGDTQPIRTRYQFSDRVKKKQSLSVCSFVLDATHFVTVRE
jgi:hypothetical protein